VSDAFTIDTHPLVWHAAGKVRKLGRRARAVLARFEQSDAVIHVPAVVTVELWFLMKNGTIRPATTFAGWWRGIIDAGFRTEPLDSQDVISASELDWQHGDVFDRMIVATTRRLGMPLLTGDGDITDSELVEVIW